MAELVAGALADDEVVLVEAPTGTGKTIAYLIPALVTDRPAIISTGTKALQEQIVGKDIPLAEQVLNRPIKAVVMKGRQNYLCHHRFAMFRREPTFEFRSEINLLPILERWLETTETGDRAEISELPDDAAVWRDICATSDTCLGQSCGHHEDCFLLRLRRRAVQADLVVVNHHLLFADLSVRKSTNDVGRVLPEYDAVILDEAHQIEDVATSMFGAIASRYRFIDWERDLSRMLAASKLADHPLMTLVTLNARLVEELFQHYAQVSADGGRLRPEHTTDEIRDLLVRLEKNTEQIAKRLNELGKDNDVADLPILAQRLQNVVRETDDVCDIGNPGFVYWRETRPRAVILHKDPIELAEAMQDTLFAQTHAVVFTSATLTSQNGFTYMRQRLGITYDGVIEEILPTCFDYRRQGVFYLPKDIPDPRNPGFLESVIPQIRQLVEAAGGRTMCLFTSLANMEAAYEALADDLPFPCMLQGEAPKHQLLERKRDEPQSVLFATASFWGGVDIAGDALRCVIIDKLPFASPSDPVTAARIEKIKLDGGNPFMDFQLPAAIITLKQGLGRLIRTIDDNGVLALLDSRMHTKGYGRRILDNLPEFSKTSKLPDVLRYLQSLASRDDNR